MDTPRCPSREDLERLLEEQLGPADSRRVSEHIAVCPACQKNLEALTQDSGSDLPSWHGRPADASATPSPNFLDRIKQAPPASRLRRRIRPPDSDGDHGLPASAGPVLLAMADAEAEPYPALENYEVLGLLGRGAEGVVYLARHRPLRRLVALKMLRDPDQAKPESLQRFRLEAETLAGLHHPHIVQVFEVGCQGQRPFFAMEYVEGGALSARLKGQPQPARESAALVEAMAQAVQAAHQAGVVHRDLKPSNILLCGAPKAVNGENGQADSSPLSLDPLSIAGLTPKVSDFGLAKRVKVDSDLTRTGMVIGTPGYMAPEQARAEGKDLGPGCDVYALGSILYHLLTGRPPFVGPRPMDVLLQVVHAEPVSLRRLFPQTPRDLETICLKCLEKDPSRRYASAAALADDLRRYLDGRPVQARPAPPWEHAWKAARRRPVMATLLAACAIGLLLLLGGGAYYNNQLAVALKNSDASAQEAIIAKGKAQESAREAGAAKIKADAEAAAARTAQGQAQASAEEAELQRGLALEAYEKLIFEVQDKLGYSATTRPVRQSLLEAAADGLKNMAKGAETAAPDRARAAAHMKMGRILYTISDDQGARTQLEACRTIAADLVRVNPHDGAARDLLCQAYSGFGNLAGRAGQTGEAAKEFAREVDYAKAWYDDDPDAAAARERLAEGYNWLAGEGPRADDPGAYERYNNLLVALVEAWRKADSRSHMARYYQAAALHRSGRILVGKGDPMGALDCFVQAKTLMDGLVGEDAVNPDFTHSLTSTVRALSAVYTELGQPDKALPYATEEAAIYRRTLASGHIDPENVEYQWEASDSYIARAAVLMRLMRHEEAAKELTAVVELLQALQPKLKFGTLALNVPGRLALAQEEIDFCKAVPTALKNPAWVLQQPPQPRQDLLIIRVCLLMQQGRTDEAEKAADLVDGQKPDNADECYTLAHFLAGEMGGLTAGKAPDAFTDAERAMRKRFIDRAVAALTKAADLGFRDTARLKADVDLWVLHEDPGYRALIQRLEKPK